jgi:DNA-binding NtrC family response regulator
VLFVDDEPGTLTTYRLLFTHSPIQIVTARSGLHGLDLLAKRSDIALVVSDYWMTGMDGIAFLTEVHRRFPLLPRILLTGEPDAEIVLEAGVRVLTKGMDPNLIRRVIVREAQRYG